MERGWNWTEMLLFSSQTPTCNKGRIRCSLLVNSNQFYSCSLLITNQSGSKGEGERRCQGGLGPSNKTGSNYRQTTIVNKPQRQRLNDNKKTEWFWGECQSGHTVRKAHVTSLLRLHLLGWRVLLVKI